MSGRPHPGRVPGYTPIKFLQSGNYGEAWLERDDATGQQVAIKYISRARVSAVDKLDRELVLHRSAQHPHVIAFLKALLTPSHVVVVMEFAAGGELFGQLQDGCIQEDISRNIFQQVVSAVAYIHTLGIAHRDLKLENVLLMSPDKPSCGRPVTVKICDFGFSRTGAILGEIVHSGSDSSDRIGANTILGSPPYMAPELLTTRDGRDYDGKKVDVWALGVLLYTMITASYPFGDSNVDRAGMVRNIQMGRYRPPTRVSAEILDLFRRIFVVDPEHRISMDGIMHHPWFLKDCPPDLQAGAIGTQPEPPGLQSREELEELARIVKQQGPGQGAGGAPHTAGAAPAAAHHAHHHAGGGATSTLSGATEFYDGSDELMGEAPQDLYQ